MRAAHHPNINAAVELLRRGISLFCYYHYICFILFFNLFI